MDALAVGQVARDLVLVVDEVPGPHGTTPVRQRREMLGGKGANQAVALAQLGLRPGLVGVLGDDDAADWLLRQARSDGIDVRHVIRRPNSRSGLIVDLLTPDGRWRYLEDLPESVLLTAADVAAASAALADARAVLVQLQQPSVAALDAAQRGRHADRLVVLDGAPADDERRSAILAAADVLRADAREATSLTGTEISDVDTALRAGAELLRRGPRLIALAVKDIGNVFVWPDGHLCLPHVAPRVVDTTGAGDAFTAALTVSLLRGDPPTTVARFASAAASATVGHPGGRPALTGETMQHHLARLDGIG